MKYSPEECQLRGMLINPWPEESVNKLITQFERETMSLSYNGLEESWWQRLVVPVFIGIGDGSPWTLGFPAL